MTNSHHHHPPSFSFHRGHGIDMFKRHRQLPEGFKPHKPGEPSPYAPDEIVELMIRTKDGLGSTGLCRAGLHDFTLKGMGEVRGHRSLKA